MGIGDVLCGTSSSCTVRNPCPSENRAGYGLQAIKLILIFQQRKQNFIQTFKVEKLDFWKAICKHYRFI